MITNPAHTGPAEGDSATGSTRTSVVPRTLIAAGTALGANSVIWAIGRSAGPIRVVEGSNPAPIPLLWGHVAATTIIAVGLGGFVLGATRRSGHSDRAWTIAAIAVAVLSAVPLWRLDIDTTSKSLLTLMHLVTGACCVVMTHLARRGTR